ncbi:hypothetical protein EIK77_007293 [Talaromyces pinophilus]|nr:hypothetical protein EIK77_007293 [Talaromyces pinophilus]
MQAFNYTPTDVFWGQLGGCLEALDAGTTMVVDHAHMNYSPQHSKYICLLLSIQLALQLTKNNPDTAALAASASSGIRSIFGYSFGSRVQSCVPSLTIDPCITPEWAVDQAVHLAETGPFGNGRVQVGLAFDAFFLPKDVIVDLFRRCRRAGTKLITSHYARGAVLGQTSVLETLDKYDLLGSDILISHATGMTDADAERIIRGGVSLSSTPETELQMGLGYPVCFQEDISEICSLGMDCHSNNGSSVPSQMRLALQAERGRQNQALLQQGKAPKHQKTAAQDVFLLGTIGGARAVKMAADIGSLEEGKLADIVIFDGTSPAIVCAADQDPIAAIVFHSSARDIEMVIVDGQIRKIKGQSIPVDLDDMSSGILEETRSRVEWSDVVKELRASRKRILAQDERQGPGAIACAIDEVAAALQVSKESLV